MSRSDEHDRLDVGLELGDCLVHEIEVLAVFARLYGDCYPAIGGNMVVGEIEAEVFEEFRLANVVLLPVDSARHALAGQALKLLDGTLIDPFVRGRLDNRGCDRVFTPRFEPPGI